MLHKKIVAAKELSGEAVGGYLSSRLPTKSENRTVNKKPYGYFKNRTVFLKTLMIMGMIIKMILILIITMIMGMTGTRDARPFYAPQSRLRCIGKIIFLFCFGT